MVSAAMSELGNLDAEAHAKALPLTRGVEWDLLDKAGRTELVSAAMSDLGDLGAEAHANALALTWGIEWSLLDQAGRKEMTSAAMGEMKQQGRLKQQTQAEAIEACARKIARSEGKDWGSMWLLTQ